MEVFIWLLIYTKKVLKSAPSNYVPQTPIIKVIASYKSMRSLVSGTM